MKRTITISTAMLALVAGAQQPPSAGATVQKTQIIEAERSNMRELLPCKGESASWALPNRLKDRLLYSAAVSVYDCGAGWIIIYIYDPAAIK